MFHKSLLTTVLVAFVVSACAPAATPTVAPATAPKAEPTLAPTMAPTAQPAATSAPAAKSIDLIDGLQREVKLDKPAQRIVSLAPSNTEILFALGAGSQIVGREELSDYPDEAKTITSVGSAFGKINAEAIIALKPDLVLAAEISAPEEVKTLEDLGLAVFWLANPKDFDGLYDNLAAAGALTGHTAEAQQLIDSIQTRYATVTTQVAISSQKPKVCYELDATDPTRPYTSGPGTFIDKMIDLAGGFNIGQALKDPFAQISSEELVEQNPDIIVLGDSAYGVTIESVGQRAGWGQIAAVNNKAIYGFDDNLISRPGPRLIDGLEQLAKLIHPELFK